MARGFVGTGSAILCVTSRLATSIKAKMEQQLTLYLSFRMEEASTCHHVATMQLRPSNGKTEDIPMCLAVVDKIVETLPACNMPGINRALSKLTPLQLADPDLEKPGRVDILLGMDLLPSIFAMTCPVRRVEKLLVRDTQLGHIIGGVADQPRPIPVCNITLPLVNPGCGLWCGLSKSVSWKRCH